MKREKRTDKYGNVFWYKPGTKIFHREDGPAIEYSNGTKCWYINGKYHREDGPAIEFNNGNKLYYFNDQKIIVENDEEFNRILKIKNFI